MLIPILENSDEIILALFRFQISTAQNPYRTYDVQNVQHIALNLTQVHIKLHCTIFHFIFHIYRINPQKLISRRKSNI